MAYVGFNCSIDVRNVQDFKLNATGLPTKKDLREDCSEFIYFPIFMIP